MWQHNWHKCSGHSGSRWIENWDLHPVNHVPSLIFLLIWHNVNSWISVTPERPERLFINILRGLSDKKERKTTHLKGY
jgi:hypothetical protein